MEPCCAPSSVDNVFVQLMALQRLGQPLVNYISVQLFLAQALRGRELVSDFAGLLKLLTARFKEARRSHRCSSLRPCCSYQHEAADALHSGYLARPGIAAAALCITAILLVPAQEPQTFPQWTSTEAADALHGGYLASTNTNAADADALRCSRGIAAPPV